jgi:dethiobiotin synthetase
VGKTLVSCALLHAFRLCGKTVVGMKPVASGCGNDHCADVELLAAAGTVMVPRKQMNPYALVPPIAPHIAAQQGGIEVDIEVIRHALLELTATADVVVVEGVGGFLVPLGDYQDTADMARILGLPVILVVGMQLGCINHALLTARAVRETGLVLAGWVANCIDPQMAALEENVHALEQRLNCPLLGVLPFEPAADAKKLSALFNLRRLGEITVSPLSI